MSVSQEPEPSPAASPEPFLKVVWADDRSEARGFVVIDRLLSGIATGGLRMRPGCSLAEVADLAREMTLKMALFELPVGGAKGGIDFDPADARADGVRGRFLEAVRPLLESRWVTAGDLGTPQAALDRSFAELGLGPSSFRAALGRSASPELALGRVRQAFGEPVDGLTMGQLIGGFGVAQAGLAALEWLGLPPSGATAVVQGFGAMGGSTARYLSRAGVRIRGVADAGGLLVDGAGLDVEALLAARDGRGTVDRGSLPGGHVELPVDRWVDQDVDLLVPAAASYCLTEDNCDRVRARLVVEAANVPTTAAAESRLFRHGVDVVPDFVANAGAAVGAWWVILGRVRTPQEACARLAAEMRPLVADLMRRAVEGATTLRAAAKRLAAQNGDRLAAEYGGVTPVKDLFALPAGDGS